VELDRRVVGRLDPRDRRARLDADLGALDVAEVGARVAVVDRVEEAALDRVLDVLRSDLAVHGRRELDAGLDLHRDGLAVLGDLRSGLGQVGNRVDPVIRLVAVEGLLRCKADLEAHLVVADAAVDVVDVVGPEGGQLAALLALRGRALSGALLAAIVVVAATGGHAERECEQDAENEGPLEGPSHEASFHLNYRNDWFRLTSWTWCSWG
jgi:hypothetical protein